MQKKLGKTISMVIGPFSKGINKLVRKVGNKYYSRGEGNHQLITDYCYMVNDGKDVEEYENHWFTINKKRGNNVVRALTDKEESFNVGVMELEDVEPLDFLESMHYKNQINNDSIIEKTCLQYYKDEIDKDNILVINPSPFLVGYFEEQRKKTDYIVVDRHISTIYSKQFWDSKFDAIKDFSPKEKQYDCAIIMLTSVLEDDFINKILELIPQLKTERIVGVFQNRLIDNRKEKSDDQPDFWKELNNSNFSIKDIILAPATMYNSGTKKSLIKMETGRIKEINIKSLYYNEDLNKVRLLEEYLVATKQELLKFNTLNALWKHGTEDEEKLEKGKKYNQAHLFPFSKEIILSYFIYKKKNGETARIFYCKTKNATNPYIRGKGLTKRVDKVLNKKTGDFNQLVLEIPYQKEFEKAIVKDIKEAYLDNDISVSFKTLWFILREKLNKEGNYSEKIARELFSNNSVISELDLRTASTGDIQNAVLFGLEENEDEKQVQYLKLINIIINTAIKEEYLTENRIYHLIPESERRLSAKQSEVFRNLSKKSYEAIEEGRIVDFLMKICIKISVYLGVMIRLFTGISKRETCALLWKDLVFDGVNNIYKLSISKFLDDEKIIIPHIVKDKWNKFRVIPLSRFLSRVLKDRWKYLLDKGVDPKHLVNCPIVMEREEIEKILNREMPSFCNVAFLNKKCKEVVSHAKVKPNYLNIPDNNKNNKKDFNKSKTDNLKSNFKNKAFEVAGFEKDELHYYMGLKGPDTFSRHYVDFKHNKMQLKMSEKLNRWSDYYLDKYYPAEIDLNENSSKEVSCYEVLLEPKERKTEIALSVNSKHGFNIIVSTCKKEK